MKRLPPNRIGLTRSLEKARPRKTQDHPETQALMRKLDKIYERLRNRARADWLRSRPGKDPSDACVSVRVECDSTHGFTVPAEVC